MIERVGDGVLITFGNGATVWFDDKGDAALFASNLAMVCLLGADVLDDASEITP